MGRRVTMKDVATAYGVSVATVSYALRNNPSIPRKTRDAIRALANKLGYRPDPVLSALVSYRPGIRSQKSGDTIAIIYPYEKDSPRYTAFKHHRKCFVRAMEDYGFQVSDFFWPEGSMSQHRLHQILVSRGIRGVVIGWGDWGDRFRSFPLEEFAVVSTARRKVHPAIDRFSSNHFNATDETLSQLESRGYTNIGFIHFNDLPHVVERIITGAYLIHMHQQDRLDQIIKPYIHTRGESSKRFVEWLNLNKPDAIVANNPISMDFYKAAGLRFPGKIGYAVTEVDRARSGFESGIYFHDAMGKALARQLKEKLASNDRTDIAQSGNIIFVNGHWVEGKTLPMKKAPQKKRVRKPKSKV